MKRIIFIVSFILTGCQAWGNWQPYSNLVQPSPSPTSQSIEPTATPQDVCTVDVIESLNLRDGAGMTYPVKDWLASGDVLTKTGKQQGTWIEVVTRDHVTGWINKNYCRGTK